MQAQESRSNNQQKTNSPTASTGRVLQKKRNRTGLPDPLKTGIENLSGYAMDDVKVHYNSSKPAQLQAHAYAHGTNIHLGPGQQKHLPHEAWHVVQQKQGRVKPTMQLKGMQINDDDKLETEAELMGSRAMQLKPKENNWDYDQNMNLNQKFEKPAQLQEMATYSEIKLSSDSDTIQRVQIDIDNLDTDNQQEIWTYFYQLTNRTDIEDLITAVKRVGDNALAEELSDAADSVYSDWSSFEEEKKYIDLADTWENSRTFPRKRAYKRKKKKRLNPHLIKNSIGKKTNFSKGKKKGVVRETIPKYPLWNAMAKASILNKQITKLSHEEINKILRHTGYSSTNHFAQRVSKRKHIKDDRWGSVGISTGKQLVMELKNAYAKDAPYSNSKGMNTQDLLILSGLAKVVVNPDSKKLVTVSFPEDNKKHTK